MPQPDGGVGGLIGHGLDVADGSRDIADAYSDFNNRRMYALILFLLIIATIVNSALHALDTRYAERRSGGRS